MAASTAIRRTRGRSRPTSAILLLAVGSIIGNDHLGENTLTVIADNPMALNVLYDCRAQTGTGIDRPIFNPDEFRDLDIDRTARAAKVAAKE